MLASVETLENNRKSYVHVLGLVYKTHDSGVALLRDGVPTLVLEQERFDRRKASQAFPAEPLAHALAACREVGGTIDAVAIPWRPDRLRRSLLQALARRFPSSLNLLRRSANPMQTTGILQIRGAVTRQLGRRLGALPAPPVFTVGHHDAHAAVFFLSPFEEAAVLVVDGYGDDAATSAYHGRGERLERLWHVPPWRSLGIAYAAVTQHLGLKPVSGEGKVMALAAYGDERYVPRFREMIRPATDGAYDLDPAIFSFDRYGLIRPLGGRFIAEFGPPRAPDAPFDECHMALARALQVATEEVMVHMARHLADRVGTRNLVITGGVALNCVANARVAADTPFRSVWVPPVASDTGAPLGAALWHWHQTLGRPRAHVLEHAYYGLAYSREQIRAALDEAGLAYEELAEETLVQRTAAALAEGRIVGWFQGRFEMGPRALGNRSMLADPRRPEMRAILNARVKHREWFRPFAPAILEDRVAEYFVFDRPDPFMTMAPRLAPGMAERIPSGVHVDGTARLQTVSRSANRRYYDLIAAFGRLTGVPVLLNTSFNDQEPIVATPQEAIACFARTGLDVLVLGDFYCERPAHLGAPADAEITARTSAPAATAPVAERR
jgi:carbamoyltransferase